MVSVQVPASTGALHGGEVKIFVCADACTDQTECVAARRAVVLRLDAQVALKGGARWLAFTDADSGVSPHWLADQLSSGADAVCGTVIVDD